MALVGEMQYLTIGNNTYSMPSGGGTQNVWYGPCSTSSSEAAKTVTTTSGDFVLATGNIVYVIFDNSNSSSSPTLSIDGSTAKRISSLSGDNYSTQNYWPNHALVSFLYDGTRFIMLNGWTADTATYGSTMLSSSISSTSNSLAATSSAVKQAYDLANGKQDALVSGTNIKTINSTSLLGSGDISVGGTQVQIVRW